MIEFRLYYECLEQAHDYILPMLANGNHKVTLVKRPKSASKLPKGAVYALQSLTTPDVLLTGIYQDNEIPLVLIEFTEAVTTEDHELQRTYGALGAYLAGMYYVKISGHKQSEKEFGGAEYNPYSTPKMLIQNFDYQGFIIADWETEGNIYTLQKSANMPSCPPEIPLLKDTLQSAVKSFIQNPTNWFADANTVLQQTKSYQVYAEKMAEATGKTELLENWKGRESRNTNLNKLRYFVRDTWVGAKINRFSHAMDPDRGILTFLSFLFSDTYKVFGIYALVRKMAILREEIKDLPTLRQQLRIALEKDEWLNGTANNFATILANELINIADKATILNQEVDFQYFWEKHQDKIAGNKVILTLAYLMDGMYLNYNGVKLVWDRKKLLGNSSGVFLDLLKKYFHFATNSKVIEIEEVKKEVDEDEVTYAIVHRVLIPNGFKIVSISYPGSQGGGAVLPEPEKGKEQPREYPDIIAVSPNSNEDVILNESKGMFKQAEIERDTAKILRYKTEPNYQKALKETLVVAKVIDESNNIRNIIIGVAFGVTNNTSTTWQPDKIDFIFRVVDREKWAIGIFNQTLRDLIPVIEGQTNFPTVYQISKTPKKTTKS
ncbi:MAG: hypothetical protein EAZ08_07910 [Cytophagales bacterium]|nr:MAG: hypothetical protein EAZ08_07910 [Cytophagales bacterium]